MKGLGEIGSSGIFATQGWTLYVGSRQFFWFRTGNTVELKDPLQGTRVH